MYPQIRITGFLRALRLRDIAEKYIQPNRHELIVVAPENEVDGEGNIHNNRYLVSLPCVVSRAEKILEEFREWGL